MLPDAVFSLVTCLSSQATTATPPTMAAMTMLVRARMGILRFQRGHTHPPCRARFAQEPRLHGAAAPDPRGDCAAAHVLRLERSAARATAARATETCATA